MKHALFSTDPTASKNTMAKFSGTVTTISSPIETTIDPDEAWGTDDDNHPLVLNPPAGFVVGVHPKTHG